jgi:hypothetical protein
MPLTAAKARFGASINQRGRDMSARAEIGGVWNVLRILGWCAVAVLLVLPIVAMQFTEEVNWTAEDFIAAGIMLGGAGLGTEFLVRQSDSHSYRLGAVLAVLAAFLTVWANLAVGMIGDEGNPYNLLFGGVIVAAALGMILARFKPSGMSIAMVVAGIAQAAVGAFGLSSDLRGGVFSMAFAGLWLLAAALFWNASRQQWPAG